MLCPVNRALHCTDHLTPHSLSSCSTPHSLSAPPTLPPIVFYLTSLSIAGPSVEHGTFPINVHCSPRTSSRGTVGRENTLHQCHRTSYRKNKPGYKDEISYLGGRYYLQMSRSTIGHKFLKVHISCHIRRNYS